MPGVPLDPYVPFGISQLLIPVADVPSYPLLNIEILNQGKQPDRGKTNSARIARVAGRLKQPLTVTLSNSPKYSRDIALSAGYEDASATGINNCDVPKGTHGSNGIPGTNRCPNSISGLANEALDNLLTNCSYPLKIQRPALSSKLSSKPALSSYLVQNILCNSLLTLQCKLFAV